MSEKQKQKRAAAMIRRHRKRQAKIIKFERHINSLLKS